jgi:hypothetical protein
MHFHPDPGWQTPALVELLDRLGVAAGANGAQGQERVGLDYAGRYPGRFYPFAGGVAVNNFLLTEGPAAWNLTSPGVQRYLEALEAGLRAGCWWGIGELLVNTTSSHRMPKPRVPADSPLLQRLFSLAATYNLPMSVHMDAEAASVAEMERLLASNRDATWLWAHSGWYTTPALLRRLLQDHPNLYAELSFRDGLRSFTPIDAAGSLRPEWKSLFEELPERFVIGTDVLAAAAANYIALIDYWRGILRQLSPATAVKIAHGNAERLLRLPRGGATPDYGACVGQ